MKQNKTKNILIALGAVLYSVAIFGRAVVISIIRSIIIRRILFVALVIFGILGLVVYETSPIFADVREMRAYTGDLEQRFAEFSPDENVVGVYENREFYFTDHTLDLEDLFENETGDNGYMFYNDMLYFATTRENADESLGNFSLFIYSCDYYGNDKSLVFERHGYNSRPIVNGSQGGFCIRHEPARSSSGERMCLIDTYDVCSGEYETIGTGRGELCYMHYMHFTGDHSYYTLCSFTQEYGPVILDPQGNIVCDLDKQMLLDSEFGEAMDGLKYRFYRYYVRDDHIYIIYEIFWNGFPNTFLRGTYPQLICEYIPERNEVVFSRLFFPWDCEPIGVEYIGS